MRLLDIRFAARNRVVRRATSLVAVPLALLGALAAAHEGRMTAANGPPGPTSSSLSPVELARAAAEIAMVPQLDGARPVRGKPGDLWADVVFGQDAFEEVTPHEVVPFKLFNPGGVAVDQSVPPGRAYIWDSGNSRVLGLDLQRCYSAAGPCTADIVLGQPRLTTSACNRDGAFQTFPFEPAASADSLCGIPVDAISILEHKSAGGMAVDGSGNLYVADFFNHRVLRYDVPFDPDSDSTADAVWGQADFAGHRCNRGRPAPNGETLCFQTPFYSGSGVAVDDSGALWVSDGGNNRILRFPFDPSAGRPRTVADLVLGQPHFGSDDASDGAPGLRSPHGIGVSAAGIVFVADAGNDRVLAYAPPHRSGMPAAGTVGDGFRHPEHVAVDPDNKGIWVFNGRVGTLELWGWDGLSRLHVIGKDAFPREGFCEGPLCPATGGFGFDADGALLAAVYGGVQDVLRFEVPRPIDGARATDSGTRSEDEGHRLFSPPGGYNFRDDAFPVGIGSVAGMAVTSEQLIVGDGPRLLFWNLPSAAGEVAGPVDGVIAAEFFDSDPAWQGRMDVDSAGRLWSTRTEGIDLWQLPLEPGALPVGRVLEPGSTLPVAGGNATQLGAFPHDVEVVGGGEAIWIADTARHRVLRVQDPLGEPYVDVILGQTHPDGRLCNRGEVPPPNRGGAAAPLDMLCSPGAVTLDRRGNLFVSDHTIEAEGNWRTLVFRRETLEVAQDQGPAAHVLMAPAADKVFPYRGRHPAAMFKPAFDAENRMVTGFNPYLAGRFVGIYSDPLGPSVEADAFLNDFQSLPWISAFDEQGNLYVADANRHRVLMYREPLLDAGAVGEPEVPEEGATGRPSVGGWYPVYLPVMEGRSRAAAGG